MKRILLLALPLMVMCFASCEKNNDEDSPIIQFKDFRFLDALLSMSNADENNDGQISEKEASVVEYLYLGDNGYGYAIRGMDELEYFTALKYLECYKNQLTSLDLSYNRALISLTCYLNQLTSLNVNYNRALTGLNCQYNQLTKLDVRNNTALESLYCNNNQLASLDISNNKALTNLSCDENQLTTLDVSKNTALTSLTCGYNQLTILDFTSVRRKILRQCFNY